MDDQRILDAISQGWCVVCLDTCRKCKDQAQAIVTMLGKHGYEIHKRSSPHPPSEKE